MKKFITTFMTIALMAVMVPLAANAQTTSRRYYNGKTYKTYKQNQKKSTYDKHRNLINIGVGTAAGTILGALIGGKKGALIGAGVGAGSAAVYSYGINPKDKKKKRKYYRRP
ncbi:MAG: hypothetical protein R2681_15275 [Pyrinomonadaceae bacterium]